MAQTDSLPAQRRNINFADNPETTHRPCPLAPNARAKGRGWTDYEKTHQIATPRPLERRVGPSLWEKKLGVAWLLLFFPYGAIRFTSIDTCWP